MNSKHFVGVLLLLIACASASTNINAQTPPSTATAEQQPKISKELEQKALVMLDEIIKDAQSFRLAENRLRLKALAANLLWKHDEPRARIYFKETIAGIVDLLNNQKDDDAPQLHIFQGVAQLRREFVQILAARDPRMAREFLRATRPPTQPQTVSYNRYGELFNDVQLEYSLATQIIETDPKQALELAEENLSKGFSYELINTLTTLKEKDREAAAKLASAMVARLRSENLSNNEEASNVAFSMLSVVFDSSTESDSKESKKEKPLLDHQGLRELLEINITLALNATSYSGRLETLAALLPQIQKYAPARLPELRRKMAQHKTAINAAASNDDEGTTELSAPDWAGMQGIVEKGTVEDLMAAAAKAQPGMREHLYYAAAMKYAEKGDIERAREIINNHITDPSMRKNYLHELDQQATLTAAEQGKMEQVRKSLANLRTNEERAMMLAEVATAFLAKGEKKIARQLLEEAHGFVNYRAKNISQLGAQLMVVHAYVQLNPERSLTMLEPIVDQLNELLAAAVLLGGFILDQEVMRDDEIRMEVFTGVLPFASYFMPNLRSLAVSDFDRTRALAERFQRDEVRMMARLLVVQSVLGDLTPQVNIDRMMNTTRPTTTTTITVADEPPVKDNKDDDDGTP